MSEDVDGDGVAEVVLIVGGRLLAKAADGHVLWQTPILELFRVDGAHDLDRLSHSESV
jgi:hypothetical protein